MYLLDEQQITPDYTHALTEIQGTAWWHGTMPLNSNDQAALLAPLIIERRGRLRLLSPASFRRLRKALLIMLLLMDVSQSALHRVPKNKSSGCSEDTPWTLFDYASRFDRQSTNTISTTTSIGTVSLFLKITSAPKTWVRLQKSCDYTTITVVLSKIFDCLGKSMPGLMTAEINEYANTNLFRRTNW